MTTCPWLSMSTLIAFDLHSTVPFYRQLYDGYRSAILEGRLRAGDRLPSTRSLAVELKISRLPVVSAFEQLLHEGYIEGRKGSGTFVKETIPDDLFRPASVVAHYKSAPVGIAQRSPGPFRVSIPALDRFPLRLWAGIVAKHARQDTVRCATRWRRI
jgi:GntR family transcriptional regulator/MocR family aminotransferase